MFNRTVQVVAQTHQNKHLMTSNVPSIPNNSIVEHISMTQKIAIEIDSTTKSKATMKRILVIAGSDSSGGA